MLEEDDVIFPLLSAERCTFLTRDWECAHTGQAVGNMYEMEIEEMSMSLYILHNHQLNALAANDKRGICVILCVELVLLAGSPE
jgi:hypothetical protein